MRSKKIYWSQFRRNIWKVFLCRDFIFNLLLAVLSVMFLHKSQNKQLLKITFQGTSNITIVFFKKKWANLGLFYRLFSVFSNKHHYNFCNKYMWEMSIQSRDSNPRPSEHESPPKTTRPGLLYLDQQMTNSSGVSAI